MHKIQSIICFDVETGGLKPTNNPIVSVAALSFGLFDAKEISRYETVVQSYADLSYDDAAMKWHGITYSQIQAGKPIKQVVQELCFEFTKANIANTHTKKPALLGHNISFDIGFLTFAFNHCKVDISKYLDCKEDGNGNMIPAYYDTMWLSRMKWGGDETMTKYNLGSCCEKANVALTDAHNAMNDVVATKDLFITFMNDIRRSGGTESVEETIKHRPREHFQI